MHKTAHIRSVAKVRWMSPAFGIMALVLWLWASLAGCAAGGTGGAMPCTTSQDCPVVAYDCKTAICVDGTCDIANSPDGTLCALASVCAAGVCPPSPIAYIKASNTGEGDVFVLPKGWSGRWDVTETVRKLYILVA